MNKSISLMIMMSFTMILLTMVSRQQHLLPTILCLESLMLLMVFYLSMSMNSCSMIMGPSVIILLTMSVSSASIGLSLLVTASRKEGNDSTLTHSINMC